MKPRKKPRQLSTAIEETPEAGRANCGTLHGSAREVAQLDHAKLDEIARVARVPVSKVALFKEDLVYGLDLVRFMKSNVRRREKRREVIALLDGLIAAFNRSLMTKATRRASRKLSSPAQNSQRSRAWLITSCPGPRTCMRTCTEKDGFSKA
jgi:hypothetical protein